MLPTVIKAESNRVRQCAPNYATAQNHLHKNIAIIVVIHTISDATALASRHLITVHPTRVAVRVPASNAAHAVKIDLINMAHNPNYIAATIPPTKIKTAKMNLIPFFVFSFIIIPPRLFDEQFSPPTHLSRFQHRMALLLMPTERCLQTLCRNPHVFLVLQ